MTPAVIERDERAVMVENASYRIAASVMSFGLLLDVMYRSWVRHESPWDLFAVIIVGGAVAAAYQGMHRTLGRQWARTTALVMIAGAVTAALIALSRGLLKW